MDKYPNFSANVAPKIGFKAIEPHQHRTELLQLRHRGAPLPGLSKAGVLRQEQCIHEIGLAEHSQPPGQRTNLRRVYNRDDQTGAVKPRRCELVICRSRFQDEVARLLDGNCACPVDELDDALDIVCEGASTFDALTVRVDHRAVQFVARYVNSKMKHVGSP